MNTPRLFVKVLVFVAYVLTMLVPALSMGRQQTQVEHARMMAMAGHEMTMADMGNPDTDQTMLLCKQHCLVVVAALPTATQMDEMARHSAAVVAGTDPVVSSLVFPPPGHPPKAAVI